MTPAPDLQLRVGGRLWLDGQGWEIAEITGSTVLLIAGGRLRTVGVTSLLDVSVTSPQSVSPRTSCS